MPLRASRRVTAALFASATVAALVPAAALATHPVASGSYSGHGTQYYNNTPSGSYTNRQRTPVQISFTVSPTGQRVLNFSGQYSSSCLSGITSVTDHWISVDRTGFFSVSGSYPSYGANHQRNGTTYATIKGEFFDSGRRARIFYQVVTRFSGPSQPACGTQVKGTVRVH
jgi:hypothetical protein